MIKENRSANQFSCKYCYVKDIYKSIELLPKGVILFNEDDFIGRVFLQFAWKHEEVFSYKDVLVTVVEDPLDFIHDFKLEVCCKWHRI